MTTPDVRRLYRAIEATWPPREAIDAGPWVLRDGAGGGQRVSAATQRGAIDPDIDLPAAEQAMRLMGQAPLFMIRQGDQVLDGHLAARGYAIKDPVNLYLCPIALLTDRQVPPVTAFAIWEPLEIMRELWAKAGIGPARLQVMERAKGPKTALFGRTRDKPAAVGFCALDGDIAMLHALEVAAPFRRMGLAGWMTRAAALWAEDWGAAWMALLCTQANTGANALYAGLGMRIVGQYHYRTAPTEGD